MNDKNGVDDTPITIWLTNLKIKITESYQAPGRMGVEI